MTPRTRALSDTVRVSGPMWSMEWSKYVSPYDGTSPCVAFMPTRPDHADGIRTLPPSSAPSAKSTMPATTAAADPLDDPPVE